MLENENKNRWSLPCGELLLSLICTGDFGKGSPLHLFYIVYTFVIFLYHCSKRKKSICRKGEGACFSWNLLCILRTTTTRHMGSFIDFYFHFLANSQTWTWPHTGSLNYLLMLWNPCDTNSEPGLPVVLTHMCQCVFVAISPLTLLYQGHIAPLNFTLTRPLLWPMWKMLMNKQEYLLEGVVQLHAFRYTGLCIPSRAVHTIVLFLQ